MGQLTDKLNANKGQFKIDMRNAGYSDEEILKAENADGLMIFKRQKYGLDY